MKRLSPKGLRFALHRRRDAYLKFFESDHGRLILVDLMEHCGWSKDQFNENELVMANLMGRRNVILHIKAIMGASDEQLDRVMKQEDLFEEDYPE
jgi:hypothetical protein